MTRPPPEWCPRCGCDIFECAGPVAGWEGCTRADLPPVELPPRPRASALAVAIDVLVWMLCAAFAGAVAVSYLIAVTPP